MHKNFLILVCLISTFSVNLLAQLAPDHRKQTLIYAQVALGYNDQIEYTAILQVTNNHVDKWWRGAIFLASTETGDFWYGDYWINDVHYGPTHLSEGLELRPEETLILKFKGDESIRSGALGIQGKPNLFRGGGIENISTALFLQITDRNTGELIDSIGEFPSSHGYKFAIPIEISATENTGIALVYLPKGRETEIKFELRYEDGSRHSTVWWKSTSLEEDPGILPLAHEALFINEIFDMPTDFKGSLWITAQRNINIAIMRMDTKSDGNVQLTSIPAQGKSCNDQEKCAPDAPGAIWTPEG